jgi:hypothetical protein
MRRSWQHENKRIFVELGPNHPGAGFIQTAKVVTEVDFATRGIANDFFDSTWWAGAGVPAKGERWGARNGSNALRRDRIPPVPKLS